MVMGSMIDQGGKQDVDHAAALSADDSRYSEALRPELFTLEPADTVALREALAADCAVPLALSDADVEAMARETIEFIATMLNIAATRARRGAAVVNPRTNEAPTIGAPLF